MLSKRLLLGLLLFTVAGCSDYSENEKIVKTIDLGAAFKTLFASHQLNSPGGSELSGHGSEAYEYTRIYTIQGKTPLPDDFTGQLASALAAQLSRAGATIKGVHSLPGIQYAPHAKKEAPDSGGTEVQFSVAGSRGLIVLHYTTVTSATAIGYLSCEIFEFRK